MLPSQIEADILRRVFGGDNGTLSPEAARELLKLGFSEADHARMTELSGKAQAGELSGPEREELVGFVNVSHLIAFVHSKARVALQRGGLGSNAA